MAECSFCGIKEKKVTPVCLSCGAPRYPIAKVLPPFNSRKSKLKLSVTLAAATIVPGSFIVLALIGANRLNTKIKDRKP